MSATPRLAATLMLLRDGPPVAGRATDLKPSVLMVRRAATGSFPSALVFPGGTVDRDDHDEAWLPLLTGAERLEADERALRIAAIRETWEEVGLFLGRDAAGRAIAPAAAPGADFRALVAANHACLPLDALAPFARWITPADRPRRWDTFFFLALAPAGQLPRCDEVETMAPEWLRPAAALALAAAGEREIIFPTRLNLARPRSQPERSGGDGHLRRPLSGHRRAELRAPRRNIVCAPADRGGLWGRALSARLNIGELALSRTQEALFVLLRTQEARSVLLRTQELRVTGGSLATLGSCFRRSTVLGSLNALPLRTRARQSPGLILPTSRQVCPIHGRSQSLAFQ